jgi:hypothetical protein
MQKEQKEINMTTHIKTKETEEDSYVRRRNWLLEKIRSENWNVIEEKPRVRKKRSVKINKKDAK